MPIEEEILRSAIAAQSMAIMDMSVILRRAVLEGVPVKADAEFREQARLLGEHLEQMLHFTNILMGGEAGLMAHGFKWL